MNYVKNIVIDYPLIGIIFIGVLPFILVWGIYYLRIIVLKLPTKTKNLLSFVLVYGVLGLLIANYYEAMLGFIFGFGGLSILALGGILLVAVFGFGLLILAASFYIEITEHMPAWGHLIIAILAPPLILVMLVAVAMIMFQDRDSAR